VNAVVTGAAGFIGSHLAEALLARGDSVRVIDAFTDYYDATLKAENSAAFEVERVDLAEDELDFRGSDVVFHLAGQPGVRSFGPGFREYAERNVVATQRVLETAAAAGSRVVLASSSSVYGDAERYPTAEDDAPKPLSPYGVTKLAAEQLAHAYARSFGLETVVLRYFTVYGPRQRPDMAFARVASALLTDAVFRLRGNASRDFTYVDDVVHATVLAAAAPAGSTYNVGGGSECTLKAAIRILERVSGRELKIEQESPALGDMERTRADITRIRDELGWQPRVELAEGLREQWDWTRRRVTSAASA
jgi:UDP-glucuronate 4-epimerase